ncbi:TPA: hypothetical protein N0F65_011168 [Lagenidium giganteum]|uniref:Guanylate cyclase domain-containing protein n=1 Tax=Lagenidium giganteum TaxID=4803 RepID=A0AAV2Z716_9STRA|nr:TPA: hypothetical protein N0F65_011168 [Lagenidium giganteum]
MAWTTMLSTLMMGASALAASMTAVYLKYRARDQRASSIRWLFNIFFAHLAVWASARCAYLAWFWAVSSHPTAANDVIADDFSAFDRLALQAVAWLRARHAMTMTVVMCIGDAAHCGISVCTFPIVYELWLLTRNSMDTGSTQERIKVHRYAIAIHSIVLTFAVVDAVFAIQDLTYSERMVRAKLFVYMMQAASVVVIAAVLLRLKCMGRNFETVHGVFVESPLYCRLKRIMLVYAFCICQYQITALVSTLVHHNNADWANMWSGISLVLFSATGLMLSIIIGCSQVCVLQTFSCVIPSDIEAAWLPQLATQPVQHINAPTERPVFVCTDIESSSALWGISSTLMQQATEIHDSVMRASLANFHGYEITTAGDSFHLAFPSIAQALGYCFEVQQALLLATWPKELHGRVPATETVRRGRRLLFRGLRVRMGIHDSHPVEGPLVCSLHAVTGKMTYTGAADIVVKEVCDLASGGQILVTQRVAEWIATHPVAPWTHCTVDAVGQYGIPQISAMLSVFQVHTKRLQGRKAYFSSTLRRTMASQSPLALPGFDDLLPSCSYLKLETMRGHSMANYSIDSRTIQFSSEEESGGPLIHPLT